MYFPSHPLITFPLLSLLATCSLKFLNLRLMPTMLPAELVFLYFSSTLNSFVSWSWSFRQSVVPYFGLFLSPFGGGSVSKNVCSITSIDLTLLKWSCDPIESLFTTIFWEQGVCHPGFRLKYLMTWAFSEKYYCAWLWSSSCESWHWFLKYIVQKKSVYYSSCADM